MRHIFFAVFLVTSSMSVAQTYDDAPIDVAAGSLKPICKFPLSKNKKPCRLESYSSVDDQALDYSDSINGLEMSRSHDSNIFIGSNIVADSMLVLNGGR